MKNKLLFCFFLILSFTTVQAQYCTSGLYSTGCSSGDDLDGFGLGSFSHTATGCGGTGAYNDYTSMTITVTQTIPQALTATTNFSASENLKVFIDYNSDQDFDDVGEEVYVSPTSFGSGTPLSDMITFPAGSPTGTFRLRARLVYASTTFTACSQETWGEIHDYTITINPNIEGGCANYFSGFDVDSISGTGAKVDWVPGAGNASFYFEYGPVGFAPGSGTMTTGTYPGSQPPIILSGLSPQTTYDYYFGEICNSGADSAYYPIVKQFTTTKLCASPTNFMASNIGAYSADFSWNQAGNFQEFYFIWGNSGFSPATSLGTVDTATTSPFTLGGLPPSTDLDVYIVTYCGTADGYSDTIGPISIRTLCPPITSFPYIEGFESISGSFPVSSFPTCWEDSSATALQWQADVGGTSSTNTGPSADHSLGTATGVYVYLETSSTGDDAFLRTPVFDLTNLNNPTFSFWYHMYGATMAELQAQASTDGGITWTTIFSISGQQHAAGTDPWTQATIDVSQFISGSTIFRFRGTRGSSYTGDMAIDDVEIQQGPACPAPGAFFISSSDSSATFNIIGGGSTYDVEWGPAGFAQGNGCSATVGNGLVTLDNTTDIACSTPFTDNSQYDIYIRNNCTSGGNGTSSWIGPITFYTALASPQGVTCPNGNLTGIFSSDFDDQNVWNGDIGTFSGQWQYRTGSTPTGGTGPTGAAIGTNYIYFESDGAGPASLVSPNINLVPATDGAELSFWLHAYGSQVGYLAVKVSTVSANGPFNDTIFLYDAGTLQPSENDPWQQVGVNLDNYLGQTIWLEFEADRNGGNTGDIAIDLVEVNTCGDFCLPEIYNLDSIVVNSVNDASVYVDASGDNFQLEWGPCGYTQGTGTFVTGTSPFNLTGLQPSSCYEVYVRRNCGGANGFSGWGGPFTFVTPCQLSPGQLPFTEGFETFSDEVAMDTTFMCAPSYSWDVERPGDIGSILFTYNASSGPAAPHTGLRSAGFQSQSNNDPIYLILTIDMSSYTSSSDPIQLSFNYADHLDETSADDKVWIRGSMNDSWIEVFDWNSGNATTSWGYFEMMLDSALNANGQSFSGTTQVRWGQQDNAALTGGDGFSLDDVVIQTMTCPRPGSLDADSITINSAYLSWLPGTAGNNSFELSIGTNLVIPEMGTKHLLNDSSFSATGFNGASDYCYFVREICSPGDTSIWSGPFCFSTPCTTFVAPYFEDFESFDIGWYQGDENCWELINTSVLSSSTSGYSWELRNTPQASSGTTTGPDKDNTLAPATGGKFFNADVSYGVAGDSAMLVSPVIDLSNLSSPQLEYHLHRYGNNMGEFYVDVYDGNQWINGVQSHTSLLGSQTSMADPYTKETLNLGQYAGLTNFQVRFRTISNGCCAGDNAIDDISIADPLADDAEANAILIPEEGCGDSATAVAVVFTNQGANPITNMPVNVEVTGDINTSLSATYTGNLQSFVTDTILVGSLNTYAGANIALEAVLGLPGDLDNSNDSITTTSDLKDLLAPVPTAAIDTVACTGVFDTLYFPTGSTENYLWLTTNNDTIGDADSLVVGPISGADTTFLLAAGPVSYDVGPANPSIGSYANVWNTTYGMYFDVHKPTTLVSVDVFPTGPGVMQFIVENSSGTIVASAVGTIFGGSQTSPKTVTLNFNLPPGTDYLLRPGASSTQSVRNSTGGNYPYSAGDVLEITGNSFDGGPGAYYYYFYNWHITAEGCPKPNGEVTIYNSGSSVVPAFSFSLGAATGSDLPVSFNAGATSGANSYSWDFGDGNTGSGIAPQHVYTSNGSYTVSLVVSGPCGTDSISQTVTVSGIGIGETTFSQSLKLFPNPSRGKVSVEFTSAGSSVADIRILDMSGREVRSFDFKNVNGHFSESLSLEGLAKGLYMLEVVCGELRATQSIELQ